MSTSFEMRYSNQSNLKPYLIKAVIFHVSFVVLAIILNYLFSLNLFKFNDADYKIEVIQSAVRVDVVGMPKLTVKELKEAVVEAPAKGEEKATEVVKEEAPKDESASFSSFLSQYSKKNVDKPKGKTKGSENAIDRKKLNNLVLEGNKVSQGTSLVGDSLKQEMTAYTTYVGNLPNLVRPNWKLPSYLMDKDLKCRVRVFISKTGAIIKTEIHESSGTSEFDQRALRAIKEVGSFPTPPNEIVSRLAAGDVILGFPL